MPCIRCADFDATDDAVSPRRGGDLEGFTACAVDFSRGGKIERRVLAADANRLKRAGRTREFDERRHHQPEQDHGVLQTTQPAAMRRSGMGQIHLVAFKAACRSRHSSAIIA